ncbi:hypothetical protein PO909_000240 [Leuciscus waleckii]
MPRRVKNYPTNEIGAFAHVSGASEVTVKHNLVALKHKRSCRAHVRNGEEDIRQVASTLQGRNKTRKMQGKMNVELLVSLVSEHKELYDKRNSDYKNLDKRELLWSGFCFTLSAI